MARTHEPCEGCPRRKTCGGVCRSLAAFSRPLRGPARRAFRVAEGRALTEKVLDLRDEMDGKSRKIIDLYYVEQLTQHEIAERLGISQSFVSRTILETHERVHELYHDAVRRFTEKARLARPAT